VLSPKRLELLREVRREPAPSVRVLASRLGRDYKRVHGDVDALSVVGLLVRDETGISAAYDVIQADFDLREVAWLWHAPEASSRGGRIPNVAVPSGTRPVDGVDRQGHFSFPRRLPRSRRLETFVAEVARGARQIDQAPISAPRPVPSEDDGSKAGHGNLGYERRSLGAANETLIVECDDSAARPAARPVKRVREIQPFPMKIERVFHGFPTFDSHSRHAEQVFYGLTERFRRHFIETAHHPLEFQHHRQRHEDGRRIKHYAASARTLFGCFGIVGVVAVEADQDVGIDRDHRRPVRVFFTRLAASNSLRRRVLPLDLTLTKP
jgi:hypothetical protein